MAKHAIYLDYNASAPMRPAVRDAVVESLAWTGNPSSVHGFGRAVRGAVETARGRVAEFLGVAFSQIVFTSGATEANHLVLSGSGFSRHLISAVEHDSIFKAVPAAEIVPVDASGIVDLAALDAMLKKDATPALVAIMSANNETGVIEPVAEAAKIVHAHGSSLLCDAVQSVGKLPLDFPGLGADYLTVSAHKFGGPTGVGAVVLGPDVPLVAWMGGGGQERGRRPGTENVPGIVGFGVAAGEATKDLPHFLELCVLRDRLEAGLRGILPSVKFWGEDVPRVANTVSVCMPGVVAETQIMAFDLAGIAVSAGAACSSGKVGSSHVLLAMGVPLEEADATIRVSLGWETQADDIARFVKEWETIYNRLGKQGLGKQGLGKQGATVEKMTAKGR